MDNAHGRVVYVVKSGRHYLKFSYEFRETSFWISQQQFEMKGNARRWRTPYVESYAVLENGHRPRWQGSINVPESVVRSTSESVNEQSPSQPKVNLLMTARMMPTVVLVVGNTGVYSIRASDVSLVVVADVDEAMVVTAAAAGVVFLQHGVAFYRSKF